MTEPTGKPSGLSARTATKSSITSEQIVRAAALADLEFSEDEAALMLAGVSDNLANAQLRSVDLPSSALPAIRFDPQTPADTGVAAPPVSVRPHKLPPLPDDLEDLAFGP